MAWTPLGVALKKPPAKLGCWDWMAEGEGDEKRDMMSALADWDLLEIGPEAGGELERGGAEGVRKSRSKILEAEEGAG